MSVAWVSVTAGIALLWLAFAATHMGLASVRWRPRLVARLGERGYQALFSLVAFAIFVPLVWLYFANKHAGPVLWYVALAPAARWALYAAMALAFVMMAAALATPSPVALGGPADAQPRGIQRVSRHGLFMGLAIFAGLHLIVNGVASDVAFFGGLLLFSVIGARHQDHRLLATRGEAYRRFHAATPFVPFTGRDTLRGLRELSPVAVGAGVVVMVLLRTFHQTLFGP
jgi:uncharacterized membrane protein